MSDGPEEGLSVRVATSLKAVPAGAWNACANPHALQDALAAPCPPGDDSGIDRDNPFVSHECLLALEESRCIGGRSGWSPAYLMVEDETGQILAAAPSFLKSHSQGEYVFDHGWADAYERAGGRYYPKLQVAAPFTPATGPRLLVADTPRADEARAALIAGLEALRAQTQSSSVHVTFAQEPDIVPYTTVAENIYVGDLPNRGRWLKSNELYRRAAADLRRAGFDTVLRPTQIGTSLTAAQRQLVEIMRTMVSDAGGTPGVAVKMVT